MTQYADADELLAMYTFDENDNELKELNERGHVLLPVIRENIKDCIVPDVAPIVHCKDCHWRGSEECAMFYRCDCGEQHTWETDNDFCSYGEKIGT